MVETCHCLVWLPRSSGQARSRTLCGAGAGATHLAAGAAGASGKCCTPGANDFNPDDPYKLLDETRTLGLTVCRGTSVMLVCPSEGFEEISNPFLQEGEEGGE